MFRNSIYNNTKKTETKWSKRSTLVHPKLYVRSFVPQIISDTTCTGGGGGGGGCVCFIGVCCCV